MILNGKVVVEFENGTSVEMTLEEAKVLKVELEKLFEYNTYTYPISVSSTWPKYEGPTVGTSVLNLTGGENE